MLSRITLTSILVILLVTGCQNYRPDLTQGVKLTDKKIMQLSSGLTKEEVEDILGEPTLEPLLDTSTWYYTYWSLSGKNRKDTPSYEKLTINFENNKLVSYEGKWNIPKLKKNGQK